MQVATLIRHARSLERAELYELHAEVSRLASRARMDDPVYRAHRATGMAAAAGTYADSAHAKMRP